MKKLYLLSFIIIFTVTLNAELVNKEVNYSAGNVVMKGYLVYDDSFEGERPGILVVHEWWGHNDYARKRANMLAELGYTALAVDMYGDGKTADHPKDAGQFASEVMSNIDNAKKRFRAAYDLLSENETVNKEEIGAIGYCFGGGVVLQMARFGFDLKGVVSFHGSIATKSPAGKGDVKSKILVCNGAEDSFVTEDQIKKFKKEMDNAGVDYKFVNLENAKHSFTNPEADKFAEEFGMNIAYNKAADEKSWKLMKSFFNEVFN